MREHVEIGVTQRSIYPLRQLREGREPASRDRYRMSNMRPVRTWKSSGASSSTRKKYIPDGSPCARMGTICWPGFNSITGVSKSRRPVMSSTSTRDRAGSGSSMTIDVAE